MLSHRSMRRRPKWGSAFAKSRRLKACRGRCAGARRNFARSACGARKRDRPGGQAKTLWWRNPWLLKLHRLVLTPARPARLGKVRREPRREALSTLEAAALVLRHLEKGPEAADALLAALERILDAARLRPRHPVDAA